MDESSFPASTATKNPPSFFIWKKVDAYHQRLESFNVRQNSSSICLPVEISPIICSRFGWRRTYKITNTSSCATSNLKPNRKKDENSSRNDDMILLSCQSNETNKCNAVICIKFNPLLSMRSKKKLTYMYREMLATSHAKGCPFKYDALSWLKNSTDKSFNENESAHREGTTKDCSANADAITISDESSKFIIPPFLIHLSKEYEILDNYCIDHSSKTLVGNNNSIILNNYRNENGSKFITEFIRKKAMYVGQYFTKNKMLSMDNSKLNQNRNKDMNTKGTIGSIVSEPTFKRMMDILTSDTSFIPLLSEDQKQKSGSSHNDIHNILQKIVSHLNNLNVATGEKRVHKNQYDNFEEKMKKFQDEMFDLSRSDDDDDDENLDPSPSDIKIEALLLSIFGWRLYKGERPSGYLSSQSKDLSISPSLKCYKRQQIDKEDNHVLYMKCNLCLNCSPIPLQNSDNYFYLLQRKDKNKNFEENELIPQTKKRKLVEIRESDTDKAESYVKEKRNISESHHKFDVINSHRYYCPYATGFHNEQKDLGDEEKGHNISMDNLGTSNPCWEIIWKSLLHSTMSALESNEQQTIEERVRAIRNKIRSSVAT